MTSCACASSYNDGAASVDPNSPLAVRLKVRRVRIRSEDANIDNTPVARHLHGVTVPSLSIDDSCEALRAWLPRLSGHHRVRVSDEHVRPLVERAAALHGHLPGIAIALTDAACARARIDGRAEVDVAHIFIAAASFDDRSEP